MKKLFHVLIVVFVSFPSLLLASQNEEKIKIKNIKCVGNERISDQTIRFYTKLEPGSYVSDDDVDSVIKGLYKTKLFASVNTFIDNEKNLVVKVRENPLINRVILKGNKFFKSKELLNNFIHSKSLTIFTETGLKNDLINLVNLYRKNGKIGVKISSYLDKLDGNRINLIFRIEEGKTSKIKCLRFIGNKDFSEDELERAIQKNNNDVLSKLFRALFRKSISYSSQYLLISTELLSLFYSSNGYIQNNIQPIVEIDSNNQVELTFLIDENQQYLFGNNEVDIETEIHDSSLREQILKFITEENNKVFDKIKIENAVEKISKDLSEKGYIFAKVYTKYTQRNNVIDVTYKVLPGKKVYINKITIDGNERTSDKVIRRKLSIVEGDAYSISEIKKSRKKLMYSDFFETVRINSRIVSDNEVNLDLDVKEKKTASLSLAGGISFPGGVSIKTDFTDRNLFGDGKELSLAFEKKRHVFSINMDTIENSLNDSDTSLGIGFFYEKEDRPNTTFNTCNWGGTAKLSYEISENLTNSLHYSYKKNKIRIGNNCKDSFISEIIRDQEGEYQISSIGYTLTSNKLDNIFLPKKGYLFRLNQDISGLGGNVNFLKSELLSFYAHPILNKIADNMTLRFKMAVGHIFSYSEKELSIGQHFFKGGNEIRGFDFSGIGPRLKGKEDKSSLGGKTYFNLTQQVDFSLPRLYDLTGIKGSFFVDYGTLFGLDEKVIYRGKYYDSKLVRVSPGFGFSIPSPFGRLRLDFGFPLVKEDYDIVSSTKVKVSIEEGI